MIFWFIFNQRTKARDIRCVKINHYPPSITIEDFLAAEASDASSSANVFALMIFLATAPYIVMILACKPYGIIVFLSLLLHN